ncbi:MAG TPA: MFS transporter [Egicoccus sp.]|nr:MFS transporter [Egicoccus sp.]HSK24001.1 MFS transporter [Egicoccus sp.]
MTAAPDQSAAGASGAGVTSGAVPSGAWRALVVATLVFTTTFWAWGLLSPLAADYRDQLSLAPVQVSLLVAVPVILGSITRVALGALTDRFGGRLVFTVLSLAVVAPLLLLTVFESYPLLLLGALLLGVSGASFAVGIPFVSGWFPPERRGTALGIYGIGNLGTAIAAFTTQPLASATSRAGVFLFVAAIMVATSALAWFVGRNAPSWQPQTVPMATRLRTALRLRVTVDLAALYAITFGGFVAFGVYLPTYLQEIYGLTAADSAARAGGFILLATLSRPVGGILSDRIGAPRVLATALAVVGVGAIVVAFELALPAATVAFLAVAAALGVGNGAVFALVGRRSPADAVGAVTGFVGAAGGLGGFLPPLVMGAVFQATGSYAIGLMLLSNVAFAGLVYTAWRFLTDARTENVPGLS